MKCVAMGWPNPSVLSTHSPRANPCGCIQDGTVCGRANQGHTGSDGNSLEGCECPVLLHGQSDGLAAFIVQQVGCQAGGREQRTSSHTGWDGPAQQAGCPPGPLDLLQLLEGAVGAQGMGDGGAALLADGILPQTGETPGLGRSMGGPSAPHHPLAPLQGCSHALQQHLQHHLHFCSLHCCPQ